MRPIGAFLAFIIIGATCYLILFCYAKYHKMLPEWMEPNEAQLQLTGTDEVQISEPVNVQIDEAGNDKDNEDNKKDKISEAFIFLDLLALFAFFLTLIYFIYLGTKPTTDIFDDL